MITILQTTDGKKLTKTFTRNGHQIAKSAYDKAFRFNAVEHEPDGINAFSELLTWLEGQPDCCVIRGRVKEGVDATDVRRLLHDADGDVAAFEERPNGCQWLLIDFDHIPAPHWLPADLRLEYLIDLLPDWFHDVSYHFQWSASAGMDDWQSLSCHIWFWLDAPWRSEIIRERIEYEGWEGVDPSPFDAVHVHYTAAPIFINMDDPIGNRSGLVRHRLDMVTLPPFIKPKPVIMPRLIKPTVTGTFESRFQAMLDKIGPNFHIPIRNAIRWYVGNAPEVDQYELKTSLEQAIASAPAGRSPKSQYGSAYLDRSIRGAMRKF